MPDQEVDPDVLGVLDHEDDERDDANEREDHAGAYSTPLRHVEPPSSTTTAGEQRNERQPESGVNTPDVLPSCAENWDPAFRTRSTGGLRTSCTKYRLDDRRNCVEWRTLCTLDLVPLRQEHR